MKKALLFWVILFFSSQCFSQLLSWPLDCSVENTNSFTIMVDTNYGNKVLLNHSASDIYVHSGVK